MWITFKKGLKIILICDAEILILIREEKPAVFTVVDNRQGIRI